MKTLIASVILSAMTFSATANELDSENIKQMTDELVKNNISVVQKSVAQRVAIDIDDSLYVMQLPMEYYGEYVMAKVTSKESKDELTAE